MRTSDLRLPHVKADRTTYLIPAFVLVVGLMPHFVACTKDQTKIVTSAAVRVADDVCKEVEGDAGQLPDWVMVACAAEGVAGGIVKVLLPRHQWNEMKLRQGDAGPGK